MRSKPVVFSPPYFYKDLRFPQCVEDLSVQELVSELPVKRFNVAILPRAARFNVHRDFPFEVGRDRFD